jgi:hypothetical protein
VDGISLIVTVLAGAEPGGQACARLREAARPSAFGLARG